MRWAPQKGAGTSTWGSLGGRKGIKESERRDGNGSPLSYTVLHDPADLLIGEVPKGDVSKVPLL